MPLVLRLRLAALARHIPRLIGLAGLGPGSLGQDWQGERGEKAAGHNRRKKLPHPAILHAICVEASPQPQWAADLQASDSVCDGPTWLDNTASPGFPESDTTKARAQLSVSNVSGR